MTKAKRAAHSLLFITLSCALSVLLHIGALILLSTVTFEFRDIQNARSRPSRKFVLKDIRKALSRVVQRTDGAGTGRGGIQGDLKEGVQRPIPEDIIRAGSVGDGSLIGTDSAALRHSKQKNQTDWQPRQEILAVSGKLLGKDAVMENRRLIPDVARTLGVPDIVYPVIPGDFGKSPSIAVSGGASNAAVEAERAPLVPRQGNDNEISLPEVEIREPSALIDEKEIQEREIEPLDDVLTAKLSVYKPFFDSGNAYFRLEVSRIGDDVLPVLPKDIVFIQDSSASMAEQRLHFCREGLVSSLELVAENDRFNIISFSDKPVSCFENWTKPGKSSMEKAKRYASNLRSAGNTDILASLSALDDLEIEEGRPCIAFVVTDGMPTTGIVESARIIRDFTANNEGVSVFTMGTRTDANMYLLDILSYCNGGATHVVRGGRWSISGDYTNFVHSISRPVLSNLRISFAGQGIEVFPSKVKHLYMDDPLVLHGKIPKDMPRITFHALGSAGERYCDMIFDMSVNDAAVKGGKELRREWALQKAYHLIGELARTGAERYREELKRLADKYDLKIPYADSI